MPILRILPESKTITTITRNGKSASVTRNGVPIHNTNITVNGVGKGVTRNGVAL